MPYMDQIHHSLEKTKEEKPSIDMVVFRTEIAELKKKRENEEIGGMMELLNINPEYLTERDAYMWERIKNHKKNPLTRNELKQYHEDVKNSQKFESFIIQKLSSIWLTEEQKNIENSKLGK